MDIPASPSSCHCIKKLTMKWEEKKKPNGVKIISEKCEAIRPQFLGTFHHIVSIGKTEYFIFFLTNDKVLSWRHFRSSCHGQEGANRYELTSLISCLAQEKREGNQSRRKTAAITIVTRFLFYFFYTGGPAGSLSRARAHTHSLPRRDAWPYKATCFFSSLSSLSLSLSCAAMGATTTNTTTIVRWT